MSIFGILVDQAYGIVTAVPPPPADDFTQLVEDAGANWHLPLGGATATAVIGANGTYFGSVQLGVTSIAQLDVAGVCAGFPGEAGTSASHVRSTTPLTSAAFTVDMCVQLDTLSKSKHVLITLGQTVGAGNFSLEVLAGGQTRAFSVDGTGTAHVITGLSGDVPEAQAFKISYRRQSGTAPSQEIIVNSNVVASDPTVRTWPAIPAGTVYIGTWWTGTGTLDAVDGLIGHVVGWNSYVSNSVLQTLSLPRSIAWAVDIDAGEIQEDDAEVISVLQGEWHGKAPVTVTAGNGSLVTTTESADDITITAGSTSGDNDDFTYTFLDANGSTSNIGTVTVDVVEAGVAPGDVTAASVAAFGSSVQDVTALSGWPAGEAPSHIVTQGSLCHGYVRRAWKHNNNNGNFINFQAGWRKGTDEIIVETDEGTHIAIGITVTHTIPAPGSGGTTRTLDKLGGADFTTWTSAIAGCAANDVLVVRARAGGEVYPVDVQTGGAVSTVNGVKVVAHPDDLAAGRRPRVHVQGTTFARYADDLNNGHWEVHQNLGGVHGTVWRTTQVVGTNKVSVGVAYRTPGGELRKTYMYTNTPNTPGGMARLLDTTYPRIHGGPDKVPAEWDLYMGPGHYLHSDGRIYIRLSPVTASVGAKAVNTAASVGPNPPWNWFEHGPASQDPNNVQLYISSSNSQASGMDAASTGISYCLRINGRSNWTIENIDFVGGGNTIECRSVSGLLIRGVRVLGWASPNMTQDATNFTTFTRTHAMLEGIEASTITCERCEFWGGQTPWYDWADNKGHHGIYGLGMQSRLFMFAAGSGTYNGAFRFHNCVIQGFPYNAWSPSRAQSFKFHQSRLSMWGMDGALVCQTPVQSLEYVRCQMFEFSLAGWSGQSANPPEGTCYIGYNLMTNFRPFTHRTGYWNIAENRNNPYMPCKWIIGHESYKELPHQFIYNNTSIGSHNHIYGSTVKLNNGTHAGVSHDGAGAGLFPYNRNEWLRSFLSRNNIGAVFPNGSLGSSIPAYGPGINSHVGLVMHANHIGYSFAGTPTYSSNYNIYHRASGMPTLSGSANFNGVITTIASNGTETARTTIAQVRTDTGQEANGSIENPLFVGSWDVAKPDSELHSNAFWCVQAGSPAASGGDTTDRSWRDLDFGTEITYAGNSWRGCMDPDASAVEQQVGPLGPLPSEL